MELRSSVTIAVVCAFALVALSYAAPAAQPDPATGFDVVKEVETPAEVAQQANADGLTPVVIPEHVHLVDKRSPTYKKYGYGGYGGGGGGCNVCNGGGGGYPNGGGGYPVGGGYGNSGSFSQSSSNSQSSSGSWNSYRGKK